MCLYWWGTKTNRTCGLRTKKPPKNVPTNFFNTLQNVSGHMRNWEVTYSWKRLPFFNFKSGMGATMDSTPVQSDMWKVVHIFIWYVIMLRSVFTVPMIVSHVYSLACAHSTNVHSTGDHIVTNGTTEKCQRTPVPIDRCCPVDVPLSHVCIIHLALL